MALDNGKDTRRPHSLEGAESHQSELEDKIVNDKAMGDKLMEKAMDSRRPVSHSVEGRDTRLPGDAAERVSEIKKSATLSTKSTEPRTNTERPRRTAPGDPLRMENRPQVKTLNHTTEVERDLEYERRMRDKKKKAFRTRIILMVAVELITLVCILGFGSVYRYMHMTQDVSFDKSKVENNNIDITQKQKMSGYWTVAVFGVDSRDGGVGSGANADVQIICNVDMATGDIKLVSVYRDTYLKTGKSNSRYAKINEAYAIGGPEQAVSALNSNLDLNIENYVTFNWKAVADAVEMLGGVDIDITDKEFYYMNAYIHETSVKAGINAQNPAANYIKGPGPQHLNGVQAVAYARLRYMDSDFERTKRQREVISQCLDHAKKADLATLTSVIDVVLPQVAFNIDTADIIELAKGISRYNIKESTGFPKDLKDQMMGKKGDCVIPVTLVSNVKWLHSVLFDDEDYKVSNAVESYSQKIADDSGYYASHKDETKSTSSSKWESKSTEETEEDESVIEENGESSGKKSSSKETDADGYIIKGTDEDGNNIYETDPSGNKVKSVKETKSKTDETEEGEETDEDETEETDEDGNVIEPTAPGPGEDTDETTKSKTGKETTEADDEDDDEDGPSETKSSDKKETTSSSEVSEPGLIDDSEDDSGAGPSGGSSSSSSSSADSGGPGSIDSLDDLEGPGGASSNDSVGPGGAISDGPA
ncbi:LCP family protein [Oribacterium sp. FC2011]|uniref:LCP family protein n=1 Tax=Oribacterium sp. FC2011 TaxID=1408311 RepID=UPI0006789C80|nr:LCP family protein [Oribacterium sp. FC2011]